MRAELTPTQRAALVAFHLAQGDGLTIGQVKRLGGYRRLLKAHTLITTLGNVVPLSSDGTTWAATFTPYDATPHTARERAAIVAYLLATRGYVTTKELRLRFGVSKQAITCLLDKLSCVLPLYCEGSEWRIITLRELEN